MLPLLMYVIPGVVPYGGYCCCTGEYTLDMSEAEAGTVCQDTPAGNMAAPGFTLPYSVLGTGTTPPPGPLSSKDMYALKGACYSGKHL